MQYTTVTIYTQFTTVPFTAYYCMCSIYLGKGHVAVNNVVAHLKSLDHHFTPESVADCKYTYKYTGEEGGGEWRTFLPRQTAPTSLLKL